MLRITGTGIHNLIYFSLLTKLRLACVIDTHKGFEICVGHFENPSGLISVILAVQRF